MRNLSCHAKTEQKQALAAVFVSRVVSFVYHPAILPPAWVPPLDASEPAQP